MIFSLKFTRLLIAAFLVCLASSTASSTASAQVVEALAKPEKILMAKRLSDDARNVNLVNIRTMLLQRVHELADPALKEAGTGWNNDFVYATVAHEFFRRINDEDFISLRKKDRKQTEAFLRWLYNNPEVMLNFVEIGPTPQNSRMFFSDWFDIWVQRPESREGMGRKAAIAVAHARACGLIRNHMGPTPPTLTTLARYDWFMNSAKKKVFLRNVAELSHFDLRFVLGAVFSNEDLEWCQNRYQAPGFQWKSADQLHSSYHLTRYREKNASGASPNNGKVFYEKKPETIQVYTEYGGVCVQVSRTGGAFCLAAGIPVFLVTQPDHLAFFWKNTKGRWCAGNDISGWNFSEDYQGVLPWRGPAATIFLYDKFHSDLKTSRESLIHTWAGNALPHPLSRRISFYRKALQKNAFNLEALRALTWAGAASNTGREEIRSFVFDTTLPLLSEHPLVLEDFVKNRRYANYFQGSTSRKSAAEYQERVYKLIALGKGNSATVAATRFFLWSNPPMRVNFGNRSDFLHPKISEHLKNAVMDEKKAMEALQLPLSASMNNTAIAGRFFEYYLLVIKRKPALKSNAVHFLSSMKVDDSTKIIVANWKSQVEAVDSALVKPKKTNVAPTSKERKIPAL